MLCLVSVVVDVMGRISVSIANVPDTCNRLSRG